jgi:hypothetical protein
MFGDLMKQILFLGVVMSLLSCSTSIEKYEGKKPEMRLEKFFNGPSKAWGVVTSRSGEVKRRFTADLIGEWKGREGTLSETFLFDDGEVQKRKWTIKINEDGTYSGTAPDVLGEGTGNTAGFAMNWKYVLKITVDGTTYNIPVDDSMYLVDEKNIINKARMTKFGFHVGDIIIFIQKP